MTDRFAPTLSKIPFLVADLLLAVVAGYIVWVQPPGSLDFKATLLLVGCVVVGAAIGVAPFLLEFNAMVKFAEASRLTTVVTQIKNLEAVSGQIQSATAQWQTVHEHANKTAGAARDIFDKMAAETRAFQQFMEKAHDTERSHLRLEVEKLHRAEGDWLQVVVRLLDQTFALHLAATRSGQAGLIEQITHFQNVCRDATRRVGLMPLLPMADEAFDAQIHQPMDPNVEPPRDAVLREVLAPGYTYQGQLLRRALVTFQHDAPLMSATGLESSPTTVTALPDASTDEPTLAL